MGSLPRPCLDFDHIGQNWEDSNTPASKRMIVGKVGHMLFFCTGAGTHNFQIASKGLQYRVKRRVLDDIRPPFTLQNFQCSIETIFAF